jgi:ClpP class serine protease
MSTSRTKRSRSRKTTRFIVIVFQSRWPVAGELDDPFLETFLRMVDENVTTDPAATEIDLWLVSNGGCCHVAYRMWRALRARCCRLRTVVPDAAKSAATLLALGSDEIVMGPASVLGPIDVQWDHPYGIHEAISGLDFVKYPDFLAKYAAEHIHSAEVAQFFQPLAENVDGPLTMRIRDELEVGSIYAEAVLSGRVQVPPANFCAKSVAKHFVYGFPSHNFSICRNQAANLGLPIIFLEEFVGRDRVRAGFNQWVDMRDNRSIQPSLTQILREES